MRDHRLTAMSIGSQQPQSRDVHHQAEELAAKLPSLLVAAKRIAATVSQGVHGRRRVGQGETFWQFRRYQPGDSSKAIDWRQSAKSQPVYVRETEWEAAESVWLWSDTSPSMHYHSSKRTQKKSERGALLLLALASLLVKGGERVALLGTGRAPASGHAHLGRLATALEQTLAQKEVGVSSPSLPEIESLPRHARIVLIGDFLSPLEDVAATVTAYSALGLRGHMVQILDLAEETLPFSGRVLFQGMESEESVLIPKVESLCANYQKALARHRDGLAALTRSVGWSFTTHCTNRAPEMALLSLFMSLSEPI